ncbi:MAG: hypothetical protein PHV68_02695 [Candidatus Gastranaerophilales bacterium]|nr:hypothetical protein [Candidatus Gastranaerophilales bacterium]
MVSQISSNSSVNLSQLQSFQSNKQQKMVALENEEVKNTTVDSDAQNSSSEIDMLQDNIIQSHSYVSKTQELADEVNDYVKKMGGNYEITENDINYALKFGRSILVNYSA